MEKTATDNVSQRNRTNTGILKSQTCDKNGEWEINEQDGQGFQKLAIILKIFGVVKF